MRFRRWLSKVYWRFSRWTPEVAPIPDRGVVIGVPHTSNWDFVLMLFVGWYGGINFRFLAKSSLFRGPFDALFRGLGGIPVYRGQERGLVREIVAMVERGERFHLVITPEATRTKVDHWKSGFYRIASEAGLPVVLGFIDRRRMACGIGSHMTLTGDVRADMDRIRAYYDGFVGVNPGRESVPRLRDEPGAPPS